MELAFIAVSLGFIIGILFMIMAEYRHNRRMERIYEQMSNIPASLIERREISCDRRRINYSWKKRFARVEVGK